MNCDLHAHTNHSDGSVTPKELVCEAKKRNLIIALTDHNTVSGLPEFLREAEMLGVTAVGGVELSTVYEGKEFHLLGLFIPREKYADVENLCVEYHGLKEKSNIDLIDKLRALGYDINYEKIQERNINGRVNRAHIAAELLDKGYVSSVSDAFAKLLDEKCGIYVPPKRLELCDAIRFLKAIGAVSVLAHPLKEVSPEYLETLLPCAVEAGLVAIETMHSSYNDDTIAVSKKIAQKFGLLESGGSDFHGDVKPGVMLGVGKGNLDISDSIYHALKNEQAKLCFEARNK